MKFQEIPTDKLWGLRICGNGWILYFISKTKPAAIMDGDVCKGINATIVGGEHSDQILFIKWETVQAITIREKVERAEKEPQPKLKF